MVDYNKLFEEINTLVSEQFQKHKKQIQQITSSSSNDIQVDKLSILWNDITNEISELTNDWSSRPNSILENISPIDHFESVDDFQEVLSAYLLCAKILSTDIPEFIIRKLCYFENGLNTLISLATNKDMISSTDEDLNICLSSITSLATFESSKIAKALVEFMQTLDNKYENVLDTLVQSLVLMRNHSIDLLVDVLNTRTSFNDCHEHMLSALSKIGAFEKSDKIYKCLKSSFLKIENKSFGALILSDYGDGRAIPALRGYAEKNKDTIEKNVHFDIKYAVEQLGGTL